MLFRFLVSLTMGAGVLPSTVHAADCGTLHRTEVLDKTGQTAARNFGRESQREAEWGLTSTQKTKAEGTGLEPATPYGALHFQ